MTPMVSVLLFLKLDAIEFLVKPSSSAFNLTLSLVSGLIPGWSSRALEIVEAARSSSLAKSFKVVLLLIMETFSKRLQYKHCFLQGVVETDGLNLLN